MPGRSPHLTSCAPEARQAGGVALAQAKRIVVAVPGDLLASVDGLAVQGGRSRSALVREAMRLLVRQRQWAQANLERLRRGYERMGWLNRMLAEEGFGEDMSACESYERALGERERG